MRLTSLYRPVAPWHLASMWALGAATVVFVASSLAHGLDSGMRGGIAVFLAWAITRELAPKRLFASLVAPFAGVAFAIPGDTDLLACLVVLLAARVASRSVGDPPTALDQVLLLGLSGWAATRTDALPAALVLAAIAFGQHPGARHRIGGAAMLVVLLVVGSAEGTLTLRSGWDSHPLGAQLLLGGLVANAILLLAWPLPRQLRTRDDRRRGPLRGARIRTARIAVVAAVVATVAWTGSSGVFALSPAAAAVVAAAVGGAGARAARSPTVD